MSNEKDTNNRTSFFTPYFAELTESCESSSQIRHNFDHKPSKQIIPQDQNKMRGIKEFCELMQGLSHKINVLALHSCHPELKNQTAPL